jgi:hypothetical protein
MLTIAMVPNQNPTLSTLRARRETWEELLTRLRPTDPYARVIRGRLDALPGDVVDVILSDDGARTILRAAGLMG